MDELNALIVVAPSALKDDLIDALIGYAGISGFTLTEAAGYSQEHSHFNVQEQVAGHRRFCRFEILHAPPEFDDLHDALAEVCGEQSVRYWIAPIIRQGHLGDASRRDD